jgi:hypothetical protein
MTSQQKRDTWEIGIWCSACRNWPFSSASKPIDLGLGFQVHWVHIRLCFPVYSSVGTLNGLKYREPPHGKSVLFLFLLGSNS